MYKTKFVVFLLFCVLSQNVKSEKTLELSGKEKILCGTSIYYLEDPAGKLTLENVIHQEYANKFVLSKSQGLSFGITPSTYWFRLNLKNMDPAVSEWKAEIDISILERIQLYIQDEKGKWVEKKNGILFAANQREVLYRNPVFNIPINPGTEKTIYFKVQGSHFLGFPLVIRNPDTFFRMSINEQIFLGAYYGIVGIMIIYNLVLFFYIKDKSFLYYILYIAAFTLNMLFNNGYLTMHSLPYHEVINYYCFPIIIYLTLGSSIFFSRNFLNTSRFTPLLDKVWITVLYIIAVSILMLFFIPKKITVVIINILTMGSILLAIFSAIRIWYLGFKPAKYFLLAFSLLFAGIIMIILLNVSLLPPNWITLNSMQIGSALESVLLSFALGNRISNMKKDKEEARTQLIKQLQENEKIKDEANRQLENKVLERTKELNEKNEKLSSAYSLIKEKNKDITDSINYAKLIQTAVLTQEQYLSSVLQDYFLFFKPRDIVSGDFYWCHYTNTGKVIIAVCDCTGHGVPGAFMSMLCIALLDEVVVEKEITSPDEILNLVRKMIIEKLGFKVGTTARQDGMDCVLCVLDTKNNKLEFAGAKSSLYLLGKNIAKLQDTSNDTIKVFNEDFIEIAGDSIPVGHVEGKKEILFTKKILTLRKQDICYLFTDGFRDQFGGPRDRRYTSIRFKQLLYDLHDKPVSEQKYLIEKTFQEWKGNREQTDDVSVLGISVV